MQDCRAQFLSDERLAARQGQCLASNAHEQADNPPMSRLKEGHYNG